MQASYAKLRSGDLGIRVEGRATTGQSVTVTKRDGSRQSVTVDRVVWSGEGVSLCSFRRETAGRRQPVAEPVAPVAEPRLRR